MPLIGVSLYNYSILFSCLTCTSQWCCKLIVALFNYIHLATFFWMFVEGLCLHIAIVWAFAATQIRLIFYVLIGWGIVLTHYIYSIQFFAKIFHSFDKTLLCNASFILAICPPLTFWISVALIFLPSYKMLNTPRISS